MGYLTRVFTATESENRKTILRTLPAGRGGVLLDLGTSDGAFTLEVAERVGAERVLGVELMPRHAAQAADRGVDVRQADLDAGLPFSERSVDVVHANQVIEHVRRTDVFLSEINRVLRPGGLACISTNNLASWHNVISLALGFQPAPAHVSDEVILGNPLNPLDGYRHADAGRTHLRLFTARSLVGLCSHHGLRPLRLRTVGYYPLPPRLARLARAIDPTHAAFLVGLFERPQSTS